MTAAKVHSILAAGIENPELIRHWQQDPRILRGLGIEPDSIDLTALKKFAGLTVKVRHNGLREALPSTFRLMNVAGLEIEVFASYAAHCAAEQRLYAATLDARTSDLIAFLARWLDFTKFDHSLLWDMVRHEWALAQLSQVPTNIHESTRVCGPVVAQDAQSGAKVPRICGAIILHEMRCDPSAIKSELHRNMPRLDQLRQEPHYFCYWRSNNTTEIQILELDEFGYYVLTVVNGVQTIGGISHQLGGSRRPTRSFLRSLSEMASIGILEFGRADKAVRK